MLTTVQVAMGKQGHSRLIFTDKDGKVIKIYTVDPPRGTAHRDKE